MLAQAQNIVLETVESKTLLELAVEKISIKPKVLVTPIRFICNICLKSNSTGTPHDYDIVCKEEGFKPIVVAVWKEE